MIFITLSRLSNVNKTTAFKIVYVLETYHLTDLIVITYVHTISLSIHIYALHYPWYFFLLTPPI